MGWKEFLRPNLWKIVLSMVLVLVIPFFKVIYQVGFECDPPSPDCPADDYRFEPLIISLFTAPEVFVNTIVIYWPITLVYVIASYLVSCLIISKILRG
ncbi:hypothetical protein HY491_03330 [Candidatus Woesearchaeota archaeon]|nr:hypothetical protein [Candidatus Woesearchaeota archaeon]